MAWRDRAQKALDANEVAEALKKLSEHNKSDSTTHNAKSNKKVKLAKKGGHEADDSEQSTLDTSMTDSESGIDLENSQSDKASEKTDIKDSTANDEANNTATATSRPPEVKLSSKTITTLENLMIEGDLLEVSMDETQHIWRLLQATEPRRSKRYPDLNRLEEQLENVREEKIKAKKKRKLELAEAQKAKEEEMEEPKAKKLKDDKGTPRKAADGKKQSRKKRKTSESSEQEEEQEDCSANPKCQRPTGKEVSRLCYLRFWHSRAISTTFTSKHHYLVCPYHVFRLTGFNAMHASYGSICIV